MCVWEILPKCFGLWIISEKDQLYSATLPFVLRRWFSKALHPCEITLG